MFPKKIPSILHRVRVGGIPIRLKGSKANFCEVFIVGMKKGRGEADNENNGR
jgi:hypothetical protein